MKSAAIVMKTGLVPLTTVSLRTHNTETLRLELEQRRREAPALFAGLPCLLDLEGLTPDTTDLKAVITLLADNGLSVIGVRHLQDGFASQCRDLKLAEFGHSNARETGSDPTPPPRSVRVYQGNVRSGQQVFWDGDLVIQGMVSAGAEVLACGDIQIMGALRGRALAGIKGNHRAIVSCLQFDAELVAIAGQYQLFDGQHECKGQAVVLQLLDDQLTLNGNA